MGGVPRIRAIQPMTETRLLVQFSNGDRRVYDCAPLLARQQFGTLSDPGFFASVRIDPGGYGISWNDDIDISEYELWVNGAPITLEESRPETSTGG